MKKIIISTIFLSLTLSFSAYGQNSDNIDDAISKGLEGNKTFLSRDNFNRLLNLGINSSSFSDGDGNVEFNFSFFKAKDFLDRKNNLLVDRYYKQAGNRFLRRIEVGISGKLKENLAQFETFQPSLKLTLLNHRELTSTEENGVKNFVIQSAVTNQKVWNAIEQQLTPERAQEIKDENKTTGGGFNTTSVYEKGYGDVEKILDSLIKEKVIENKEALLFKSKYDEIVEMATRRSLLTLEFSGSMGDVNTNSQQLELKHTTALNPNNPEAKPWDFETFGRYLVKNDTTTDVPINNGRKSLVFGANINKVFSENEEGESTLEFKLGTDFTNIIDGILPEEKRNTFTFNAVLTPRLAKDLYLPLSLKYDPENSNFLGFFSLSWNIGKD